MDAQTIGIEVETVGRVATSHQSAAAKHVDVAYQGFTEIGGRTVVAALPHPMGQGDGKVLDGVELLRSGLPVAKQDMAMRIDEIEHRVAAGQRIAGIEPRIVAAGGLEQSHQDCRLLIGETVGGGAKIAAGSRLDTEGIAAKVYRIEIHGEDFLLREHHFQFDGHYPFLGLHDKQLHAGNASQQACGIAGTHTEHVLGQLLGDGTGSACPPLKHVLGRSKETLEIDATMLVETLVLRINQRVHQQRREVGIFHRCPVFIVIAADELAIGTVDFGSLAHHGILDVGKAGRTTEEVKEIAIDSPEQQHNRQDDGEAPYDNTPVPRSSIDPAKAASTSPQQAGKDTKTFHTSKYLKISCNWSGWNQ